MESNIFYHFLDRELRTSVDAKLTDALLLDIVALSLLMTNKEIYLSISNLFESAQSYPKCIKLIEILREIPFIQGLSSHATLEEFIGSRQILYKHDAERYPIYFKKRHILSYKNISSISGSTTKILQQGITKEKIIYGTNKTSRKKLKKTIQKIIKKHHSKAITIALFEEEINSLYAKAQERKSVTEQLKLTISRLYTKRYLKSIDGTLITGIPQIAYYDILAKNSYSTNYVLYRFILSEVGLDKKGDALALFVTELKQNHELFIFAYKKIKIIIEAFEKLVPDDLVVKQDSAQLYRYLKLYLKSRKIFPKVHSTLSLIENIEDYIKTLSKQSDKFKQQIIQVREEVMNTSNREAIIIIGITKVEYQGFCKALKKYFPNATISDQNMRGVVCKKLEPCDLPIYYISPVGMGLSQVGGIIQTVTEVIKEIDPKYLIMGGIAFGAKKNKHKIGDILVGQQVWNYEPSKETETTSIYRGDKETASQDLLAMFKSTDFDYQPINDASIHFGLLASGDKLINSEDFLLKLVNHELEIIGGDMEAAGLMNVCNSQKKDCIVIKAICDWGYNKEDTHQDMAAENAFDYIMYTISKKML